MRNIKKGTIEEMKRQDEWGNEDYGFGKDAHR